MPKPRPTTDYKNVRFGLLSPDGKLYKCEYWGHDDLIYDLGLKHSYHGIQQKGWVVLRHIWIGDEDRMYWNTDSELTQKQLDVIWDYCQENGKDFPRELKDE